MSRVHPAAAVGFDRAAGAYERGRASYPAAAVETILAVTGAAPGRTLLELGAGTGKLTHELVGSGARVLALEPVAGMREVLTQNAPAAELLAGVAESIPLAHDSVDAVIAAQSYHWFDPEAATAEAARVLPPGGVVALIWNRRDESVDWMRELTRILDGRAGDAPRYRTGLWRRGFDTNPAFAPLALQTWPHRGAAGRDVVLDRVASMSFVAALDDEPRAELLAEIGKLLDTHPDTRGRHDVAIPYVTELFTTRRLP
ncbi:MAG TPA: class I SAM-dependent methyltransferase [Gaiellales bacterium]|nr:class I SAM-dependent methyltransferase [Gaiellales bacterium]